MMDHVVCFYGAKGISLIEWPSRLGQRLPPERLEVNIKIDQDEVEDSDECKRYISLTPHGKRWEERLDTILEEGYLDDLIVDNETEQ